MTRHPASPRGISFWNLVGLYCASIALAITVFLAVRHVGGGTIAVHAPSGGATRSAPNPPLEGLGSVLVAIVAIVASAQFMGRLMAKFGQPPVIGEVIAGLLLGPSCLGSLAPNVMSHVLPQTVGSVLGVLAQVGVVLYMLLVGLEFDANALRSRAHAAIAISHASILVPFVSGVILAVPLYARLSTGSVSFTAFALFIGVAMSVTAYPVLARILSDNHLLTSRIGAIAIASAAVDDVTAWCLLALTIGVANEDPLAGARTVGWTGVFVAGMLCLIRPALAKLTRSSDAASFQGRSVRVGVLTAALLSAATTEAIGIHAIFGAFLFGALIPRESTIRSDVVRYTKEFVVILLLPIFFAHTGLRVHLGLLHGVEEWVLCAVILVVACLGKFGGGAVAARLVGLGWRDAVTLGALMNTRGLVELIVVNIGLDLGILSPALFAMFVMMAVLTTMATSPVVRLMSRRPEQQFGTAGEPIRRIADHDLSPS